MRAFNDKMLQLKGLILAMIKILLYLSKYFARKKFYLLLHPMKFVPNCFLILLAIMLPFFDGNAAPGNPPPPSPDPPPGAPIDSGIILLLFAAILYGIFKVYEFNKNKKTSL